MSCLKCPYMTLLPEVTHSLQSTQLYLNLFFFQLIHPNYTGVVFEQDGDFIRKELILITHQVYLGLSVSILCPAQKPKNPPNKKSRFASGPGKRRVDGCLSFSFQYQVVFAEISLPFRCKLTYFLHFFIFFCKLWTRNAPANWANFLSGTEKCLRSRPIIWYFVLPCYVPRSQNPQGCFSGSYFMRRSRKVGRV